MYVHINLKTPGVIGPLCSGGSILRKLGPISNVRTREREDICLNSTPSEGTSSQHSHGVSSDNTPDLLLLFPTLPLDRKIDVTTIPSQESDAGPESGWYPRMLGTGPGWGLAIPNTVMLKLREKPRKWLFHKSVSCPFRGICQKRQVIMQSQQTEPGPVSCV